jgi:hypothetical protein
VTTVPVTTHSVTTVPVTTSPVTTTSQTPITHPLSLLFPLLTLFFSLLT